MRFVVPMTSWWSDKRIESAMSVYIENPATMEQELAATRAEALKWLDDETAIAIQDLPTRKRYAALAGLILWAAARRAPREQASGPLKASEQAVSREGGRRGGGGRAQARVLRDGRQEPAAAGVDDLPQPSCAPGADASRCRP